MIYPKKNVFIRWFMHQYAMWQIRINFHDVLYDDVSIDPAKPLLLLANHFGYWDGMLLYYINHRSLKKNFHVMMGSDTAKMINYLKYTGAYTISKNSRQMLESLDFTARLLTNPQNMVLLYPQGKLYSNFVNVIRFQKGVQKIVDKTGGDIQLVFASVFIQYLKHKKPVATVYFKSETINYAGKDVGQLQQAYQEFYQASKHKQTEIDIQ